MAGLATTDSFSGTSPEGPISRTLEAFTVAGASGRLKRTSTRPSEGGTSASRSGAVDRGRRKGTDSSVSPLWLASISRSPTGSTS